MLYLDENDPRNKRFLKEPSFYGKALTDNPVHVSTALMMQELYDAVKVTLENLAANATTTPQHEAIIGAAWDRIVSLVNIREGRNVPPEGGEYPERTQSVQAIGVATSLPSPKASRRKA